MQFDGINQVYFAGTDFTEFRITIQAESGDAGQTRVSPIIADPQKASVLPSTQFARTVVFHKITTGTVTVTIQGSIDGQNWVDIVSFNNTGRQFINDSLPFWRLSVTLPSTPTPPYTVGIVGIVTASG